MLGHLSLDPGGHVALTPSLCRRGYTMIEVMVSMSIMSIGILGLVGMQINAIRANRQGGRMSQALFLAESKVEEMLATNFNDPSLVDSNTGNDEVFGQPFVVPTNTVIDATSFAETNGFDPFTLDAEGRLCNGTATTLCGVEPFAAPVAGFQRFWQITNEKVNASIAGPSLKHINVVVRFRDNESSYGFRMVQVTASKAWDL